MAMRKIDELEKVVTTALEEAREQGLALPGEPGLTPEEAFAHRYAMPPLVLAALKRAGKTAVFRLLELIESDTFSQLKADQQARLIELAMDKAYGKADSTSAHMTAMQRAGVQSGKLNLGEQLDKIEQRWKPPEMIKSGSASSSRADPSGGDDFAPGDRPRSRPSATIVKLARGDVPVYGVPIPSKDDVA